MSDLSVLRWRIDQQSELIMKLKKQLDESTSKLKVQEKINEDTRNINRLVNDQLQEGEQKILALEKESSKLSSAFNELVKVRDNLKEKNVTLRDEISRAQVESKTSIAGVVEEKCQQVQQENKLIASAQVLLGQLDTEYTQLGISNEADVLLQEKELLESIHVRTKAELEKMTEEVECELSLVLSKLEEITKRRKLLLQKRDKLINHCETENEELTLSIEKKTKQIEEEKSKQSLLEKNQEIAEKELTLAEDKFKSEKHLIYPDLLIEKLTADLDRIHSSNKNAMKEFSAYQKHTEYLIKREQQLNRRFQMLSPQE